MGIATSALDNENLTNSTLANLLTTTATLSRQPLDRLCLNTQTDSSDLTQSPRWQTASNPSRCERASSSETPSSAASKWSLTSSTPTVPTSPRMNSVASS